MFKLVFKDVQNNESMETPNKEIEQLKEENEILYNLLATFYNNYKNYTDCLKQKFLNDYYVDLCTNLILPQELEDEINTALSLS